MQVQVHGICTTHTGSTSILVFEGHLIFESGLQERVLQCLSIQLVCVCLHSQGIGNYFKMHFLAAVHH